MTSDMIQYEAHNNTSKVFQFKISNLNLIKILYLTAKLEETAIMRKQPDTRRT
jgi:hypothetical protein